MKGMDNNAPHGFFGGESDSYEQMMLMGGLANKDTVEFRAGWVEQQEGSKHR